MSTFLAHDRTAGAALFYSLAYLGEDDRLSLPQANFLASNSHYSSQLIWVFLMVCVSPRRCQARLVLTPSFHDHRFLPAFGP